MVSSSILARLAAKEAENARFVAVPLEQRQHQELMDRLQRLFVECWRPRIIPPAGMKGGDSIDSDASWVVLGGHTMVENRWKDTVAVGKGGAC